MKKFFLNLILRILRLESSLVLRRFKPDIVAVTGSSAKSSCKEAIWKVLFDKFNDDVAKSYGNLNTEWGAPLAILGFKKTPKKFEWPFLLIKSLWKALFLAKYPKILILELAADKPGDLDYLLSFIKPRIGVVTTVGFTHLEKFGSIEKVFAEKSKLVKSLPKTGFAILNRKDPLVFKMAKFTQAEKVFYDGEGLKIPQEAAKKVAEIYQIDSKLAEKSLKMIKPLQGRMNLLRGIRNSKIIDDTYNSNPNSAQLALDFLAQHKKGRRVAFLGDMLELGKYTAEAHLKIAKKAKESSDFLVLVGENFQPEKNMADLWFKDSGKAAEKAEKLIQKNDVVLVKGSRGIKMEKIVEKLCKKILF